MSLARISGRFYVASNASPLDCFQFVSGGPGRAERAWVAADGTIGPTPVSRRVRLPGTDPAGRLDYEVENVPAGDWYVEWSIVDDFNARPMLAISARVEADERSFTVTGLTFVGRTS